MFDGFFPSSLARTFDSTVLPGDNKDIFHWIWSCRVHPMACDASFFSSSIFDSIFTSCRVGRKEKLLSSSLEPLSLSLSQTDVWSDLSSLTLAKPTHIRSSDISFSSHLSCPTHLEEYSDSFSFFFHFFHFSSVVSYMNFSLDWSFFLSLSFPLLFPLSIVASERWKYKKEGTKGIWEIGNG